MIPLYYSVDTVSSCYALGILVVKKTMIKPGLAWAERLVCMSGKFSLQVTAIFSHIQLDILREERYAWAGGPQID